MEGLRVQQALNKTLNAIADKFHRFSEQQTMAFEEHLADSRSSLEQFLIECVKVPHADIISLHQTCDHSNAGEPNLEQPCAMEVGYLSRANSSIAEDQAMELGRDIVPSERTRANLVFVEGQDEMQEFGVCRSIELDEGDDPRNSYQLVSKESFANVGQSTMVRFADDDAVPPAPGHASISLAAVPHEDARKSPKFVDPQPPSRGTDSWRSRMSLGQSLRLPSIFSGGGTSSHNMPFSRRSRRRSGSFLSNFMPSRITNRKRFTTRGDDRRDVLQLTSVLRSFVVDVESTASEGRIISLFPRWETLLGRALSAEDHENEPGEFEIDDSTGLDTLALRPSGHPRHPRRRRLRCMSAIHPASSKRLLWDITSIVFVLYDIVLIPLVVFDVQEAALALVALFFWTLDIMISFISGYQLESTVETRLKYSAFKYLRTWFAVDMIVIIPDWVVFCLSGAAGASGVQRLGKLAKNFRLLRGVRLLRIFRLTRAWRMLQERLTNEYILASLEFGKLVLILVIMNHYSACAWYGISKLENHGGWVQSHDMESATMIFKYLTSLHWSMSQFHGSMEVYAHTSVERAYALACVLVGLVCSSIFISSITSLIMRAQKLRQEKFLNTQMLCRFLDENGITTELSLQIKCFAIRAMNAYTTRVNEVELLKILPAHLLDRLYLEVKTPVLQLNAALKLTQMLLPSVVSQICRLAVHYAFVKRGGLLFEDGEVSGKMFLVWRGKVVYKPHEQAVSFSQRLRRTTTISYTPSVGKVMKNLWSSTEGANAVVGEGKCVAEMNLWTSWHHRGDLMISGAPTVFSVDVERYLDVLMEVIQWKLKLALQLGSYAAGYIAWMRRTPSRRLDDLSAPSQDDLQYEHVV